MNTKFNVKPGSPSWIAMMIAQPVLVFLITSALKPLNIEQRFMVMRFMGIGILVYFLLYKIGLYIDPNTRFNVFNEFPLQMCNIITILEVVGFFTGNKYLLAFGLVMGFFSPFMAFLMPDPDFVNVKVYSIKSIGFYGYHGYLFVNSLLIGTLGLVKLKVSYIPVFILISFVAILFAHSINLLLRKSGLSSNANYIYTFGLKNPIMNYLRKIIPYDALFELPLLLTEIIFFFILYPFFK